MNGTAQPTVAQRPGQGYWDRLREIDAILARRSTVTPAKRAQIEAWLASDPRSAKRRAA